MSAFAILSAILLFTTLFFLILFMLSHRKRSEANKLLQSHDDEVKRLLASTNSIPLLEERLRVSGEELQKNQKAHRLATEQLQNVQLDLDTARTAVARLEGRSEEFAKKEQELAKLLLEKDALGTERAQLQAELARSVTRVEEQKRANEKQSKEFHSLAENLEKQMKEELAKSSMEAVKNSQQELVIMNKELLAEQQKRADAQSEHRKSAILAETKPLQDGLKQMKEEMQSMQKENAKLYGEVSGSMQLVHKETAILSRSLKKPTVRGRFGEMILKNVVEAAGMTRHCDFEEQPTYTDHKGGSQIRPDLVVKLPNDRCIIVDAKTPMEAFLEAADCDDDQKKKALLARHAVSVKGHAKKLAEKKYSEKVEGAHEYVVMFLPNEALAYAAFDEDNDLFDFLTKHRILLATPMTLVAMLQAAAMGWKEKRLAENAEQICSVGKKLHERIAVFAEHFFKIGESFNGAVGHYNKAVGSLESRLLPTARELGELEADSSKPLAEVTRIEVVVRSKSEALTVSES